MTPPVPSELDDDMHDPRDRRAPFPLGAFLRICDPDAGAPVSLRKDFDDADARAEEGHKSHGGLIRWSVICGLVAVFAGLAQNLFSEYAPWLEAPGAAFLLELLFTLGVLVLALVALLGHKQETWLIERYKAERLRLAKFRALIEPNLWQSGASDLSPVERRVEAERRRISSLPDDLLDALKYSDALPDLPKTEDCLAVDGRALTPLLDYYRRKRLDFQMGYFERKAKQKAPWIENNRLQPLFFFLAIALSLANLLLEWQAPSAEKTIRILVLGSLVLPFVWAGIRSLRGAHEFTRNKARSHARLASLGEIQSGLNDATTGPPEKWDRVRIFGYLFQCEGLLAADQLEWIRLMKEAETYG